MALNLTNTVAEIEANMTAEEKAVMEKEKENGIFLCICETL